MFLKPRVSRSVNLVDLGYFFLLCAVLLCARRVEGQEGRQDCLLLSVWCILTTTTIFVVEDTVVAWTFSALQNVCVCVCAFVCPLFVYRWCRFHEFVSVVVVVVLNVKGRYKFISNLDGSDLLLLLLLFKDFVQISERLRPRNVSDQQPRIWLSMNSFFQTFDEQIASDD